MLEKYVQLITKVHDQILFCIFFFVSVQNILHIFSLKRSSTKNICTGSQFGKTSQISRSVPLET